MSTATRPLRSTTASTNGHEFSEKLTELRTLLADIAKSAPAAASETFDELKTKASAFCDVCEDGAGAATKSVVRTVREHPAQVALAAVGAGLLAWWLLTRGKNPSA
jgi:hypothetical protein